MSEKESILEAVTKSLTKAVPGAVSDAVQSLAAKEDDPLVSGVLGIVADFVKANGTDAIEDVAGHLQSLIDGSDPMAIYKLKESGVYMSDLVDALQGAESARKARATRMTRALAITLRDVSTVVVKAAILALK